MLPARLALAALALLFCACAPLPGQQPAAAPDLVDLAQHASGVRIAMRYASADNFVGRPVDGYHAPRCLLSRPAAQAIAAVQAEFSEFGLALVMYDCYRPQRAVDHFARWARDPADQLNRARFYPNEDKATLFERGYIAERSGHSRASTVDLGLVDAQGAELDMGTGWDFLDPRSATADPGISDSARRNRLLLRSLMGRHGFTNYAKEWWHYTLRDEPYPEQYFDIEIR